MGNRLPRAHSRRGDTIFRRDHRSRMPRFAGPLALARTATVFRLRRHVETGGMTGKARGVYSRYRRFGPSIWCGPNLRRKQPAHARCSATGTRRDIHSRRPWLIPMTSSSFYFRMAARDRGGAILVTAVRGGGLVIDELHAALAKGGRRSRIPTPWGRRFRDGVQFGGNVPRASRSTAKAGGEGPEMTYLYRR